MPRWWLLRHRDRYGNGGGGEIDGRLVTLEKLVEFLIYEAAASTEEREKDDKSADDKRPFQRRRLSRFLENDHLPNRAVAHLKNGDHCWAKNRFVVA